MNYQLFRESLHHLKLFSIEDVKKLFPSFDFRRLVEWQNKGYVKKVINRWYLFSDIELDDNLKLWIANRIYQPSYISLESALAYYHLIPEAVYTTTSVTSNKTASFEPFSQVFSYRHIRPTLFFGYGVIEWQGFPIKMAQVEKVLLDYLYLNTHINTEQHLEALRLNVHDLREQLNLQKLNDYMVLFGSRALSTRVGVLLKHLEIC